MIETTISEILGQFQNLQNVPAKLIGSVAIIVFLWFLFRLIKRSFLSRIENLKIRYSWLQGFRYTFLFIGVIWVGSIWIGGFGNLATFIGLIAAGLAIALKEVIGNLAAWLFIMFSRPFKPGDRIQIGNVSGDVIDLQVFRFTLLETGNWVEPEQATGRIVYVPNLKVFTDPVANYAVGMPFIWNEIQVTITQNSDWQQARKILMEILERQTGEISQAAEEAYHKASQTYLISFPTLKPSILMRVKGSGIQFTLRYLCEPALRRPSEAAMWEAILSAFTSREDIQLFPAPLSASL